MKDPPASRAIERLSPTSYEVLQACPLRFSFGRQPGYGVHSGTPATRLGTVCHHVLDRAVREGGLRQSNWRDVVQELWDEELAVEVSSSSNLDHGDPRKWPGYQLKRARLFEVADSVREFLEDLPSEAEVLTEVTLSANDGLLYGRADLVIRSKNRHQIIDYKSGGVVDRETQLPRIAYARQLQLYAYLEHASSGKWPSTAHLFPLHGAPVAISVEPTECLALASDALEALRDYNAAVPAPQPARPSMEHCKWCPAATVCAAFWAACSPTWAASVCAVTGTITNVFSTELGGVTVHVKPLAGSLDLNGSVVIKNIDPVRFPNVRGFARGEQIGATGLLADDRGSGYWLGVAGAITALP